MLQTKFEYVKKTHLLKNTSHAVTNYKVRVAYDLPFAMIALQSIIKFSAGVSDSYLSSKFINYT